MPRTVNEAVYRVRRDAFLDAAQELIQTSGYEQMSIQDVLDRLDTSRGAFYHYFDSKQALLEAVVDRLADAGEAAIAPILADPTLPALGKLERVFSGIASFKAGRKQLIVALIQVWQSDGNALVREKLRRMTARRIGPVIGAVIREGNDQGTLRVASPEHTAQVLVGLIQGYQELAVDHFLGRQDGTVEFEEVERSLAAVTDAFARILGVEPGSVTVMDADTLRFWFG